MNMNPEHSEQGRTRLLNHLQCTMIPAESPPTGWRAYFVRVTLAVVANLTPSTIAKVDFYLELRYSFTKLVVVP